MSKKSRRKFIKNMSAITLGGISLPLFSSADFSRLENKLAAFDHADIQSAAQDEDFWFYIQQAYTSSPNFINLNNGGVCPQPLVVQEAMQHYNRLANESPAFYMFNDFQKKRATVRKKLALLAGCSDEEINLCRNTTEAIETLIFGLELEKGDEILTTNQDYPTIMQGMEQRSRREGIVVKKISIPVPAEDKSDIVSRFEQAITRKTKLIVASHIVYLTGQIMPIREISDMAHAHGVEVVADGAHSFAHLDFKIPDLHCDYYGTSLHKWLGAPFGCGMLYIKKEKIGKVWSLFGSPEEEKDQMSKFDHLGTRSFPAELAISEAIDFHKGIGAERKEARLRYLKNYWAQAVKDVPGVTVLTSLKEEFSGGMAIFNIEGWQLADIYKEFNHKYKIHTNTMYHDEFVGIRISPNVYTTMENLDMLIEGIKEMAG